MSYDTDSSYSCDSDDDDGYDYHHDHDHRNYPGKLLCPLFSDRVISAVHDGGVVCNSSGEPTHLSSPLGKLFPHFSLLRYP